MAANSKGITFRRVNGRIIPIKMSATAQQKSTALKGAALVTVGAATAASSGKVWKAALDTTTKWSVRGWNSLDKAYGKMNKTPTLFDHLRKQKIDAVTGKLMQNASNLGRATPLLRLGGIGVGSALIGAGAYQVHKAFRPKASKSETAGVTAAATVAATGAFLTGAYGAAGFRSAIKPVFVKAYPLARKLALAWKL